MKLRSRLISAIAALAFSTSAFAGNFPNITGPWDPTNTLGGLNQWVQQSLNPNSYGMLFNLPAASITSGTTAFTWASYTIPAGQALQNTTFHWHAAGTNSADANVKTVTFNYGAASIACVVTGNAATWAVDLYVTQTGAATQISECNGVQGAAAITTVFGSGTVANSGAIATTLTGTAATAGTMNLGFAYLEMLH